MGYVGLQGAETVLQALAVGRAEIGAYNPLNVLPAEARGQGLPLKVVYLQHQRAYWEVRVNQDSPIKEYKDLAGKKIGIIREGDTGPNAAKFHFRQIGIDPDKDVTWPVVGQGASAGQAIKNGTVDALAIWDVEFARMEMLGFKLRQIPNPGNADKLFGFGLATRANLDWKEHIPKFIRGYIKSTIFTIVNPEAAIRLHWDLYPDSKPTGIPEEQAIQEQKFIINVRAPWYGPRSADGKGPDLLGPWCYMDPARWDAWVEFLGLQDKIKDPSKFYTNEFVEEANNFDKAAVIQMAREFKF
ncbi:MAG: ABC transporter substrate-binding protein [Chloroflexi bacterium]|nr:ABC transporter substrate-binding protein [Chloroflexota bacterium]